MSSPWFHALTCLFLVGCSEQLSGEWSITSVQLGSGAGSSLSDLEGTVTIDRDGLAELDLLSGDLEGDYLEINVEGTATSSGEGEFSMDLTGFQEEPQNAIFVDLTLDCLSTEVDAECTGLWESLALESQEFTMELSAL